MRITSATRIDSLAIESLELVEVPSGAGPLCLEI
jgi:hypothetical protein